MVYQVFIDGLLFMGGSWGCPALVGDNTQQGLREGISTRVKKHSLLFIIASCAFCFITKAQGFSKRYIDVRPAMQYTGLLIDSSAFYTMGVTTKLTSPFPAKPFWSKVSLQGVLENYYVMNDTDNTQYGAFHNSFSVVNDSIIKFFGYVNDTVVNPMLWTISKNGVLVKTTRFLDSVTDFIRGDYMTCNEFGNCFLACNYQYLNGNVDCNIISVNKQDSVIWNYKYGISISNWWEIPTSIHFLKNGNTIVGSSKFEQYSLPNMKSYTWLFEIDSNGLLVRQWFDSDSTMEAKGLKQTKDGGFIYASKRIITQDIVDVTIRPTVVKMDSTLTVEWRWEHPQTMGSIVGATDIEQLPNGDFIVCGKGNLIIPNTNLSSAFIMKLGSDGIEKWKQIYTSLDTPGTDNYLNDIDVLSDGSYVAVGYTNLPSSVQPNQRQQAWMLKIDSNGCEVENCLVGINNPQAPKGGFNSQIQIQPNPASSQVEITIPDEMIGGEVKVFDVTGKAVREFKVSSLPFTIDVSVLSKGLYVIAAEKEGKFARGKLMVE